ncbi:MAG: N-acetyltransferase [Firmicutes bacterium HGW-Firmicutes-1]|nr:MAG: N-acetyltransferase [Firmicutes bacterium HGW-Firmicutes-1]
MNFFIDQMKVSDWNQASNIYLEGIQTGNATFQNEVPTWEEWDRDHLIECRFVARCDDNILGWVALSSISNRPVFRGVAEDSIYIKNEYKGIGVASALMQHMIMQSELLGFWTLEAKIFPENIESINLHQKFGFKSVGIREKIGQSVLGVWRDIVVLERRSEVVGR